MAKKGATKAKEEPLKLFYIFYSQERWDNWIKTLQEANFEVDETGNEMPEGLSLLYKFTEDITISVLKIIRLYQNNRFPKDEALGRLQHVEDIIMNQSGPEELADIVESVQISLLVLFAACKRYISGEFEGEIKTLIKKGRALPEEKMEEGLEIGAIIGAQVINGASCCAKYIKDESENPTLFDEWLTEIETMNEAIGSLKNFDEETGEEA